MVMPRVLFIVLALFLSACTATSSDPPPPMPEEETPAVARNGSDAAEPSPEPPTRAPEVTQDDPDAAGSLPAPLLQLERTRPDSDFCLHLVIDEAAAVVEHCAGGRRTLAVEPETATALVRLAEKYRSFEERVERTPGELDSLVQTLHFHGRGTEAIDDAGKAFLYRTITGLLARAHQHGEIVGRRAVTTANHSAWDALAPYREAVADHQGHAAPPDRVTEHTRRFLAGLLDYAAGAALSETAIVEDELAGALVPADQSAAGPGRPPQVRLTDVTGDDSEDLLVAPGGRGLPVVVLLRAGEEVTARRLPSGQDPAFDRTAVGTVAQVADLTGDGVQEIVVTYAITGASAVTTSLRVYAFEDGRFVTRFDELLTNWAGGGKWNIDQNGEITTTCAAFGVFDAKLVPHPFQTHRYRYHAEKARYQLVEFEQDAPETRRMAVNEAEAALRGGRLHLAIERFLEAATGDLGDEDVPEADWTALAYLRLAMLYALDGQTEAVQPALDRAAQAQALEPLATAFGDGYEQGGPVAAWAALAHVSPQGSNYLETRGSLRLGGFGIVALLNEQPEAFEMAPPAAVDLFREHGLPVVGLGPVPATDPATNPAILVQLSYDAVRPPGGTMEAFWLIHRLPESERFHATFVDALPDGHLDGVIGYPPAIVLRADDRVKHYAWYQNRLHTVDPFGRLVPREGAMGMNDLCRVRATPAE